MASNRYFPPGNLSIYDLYIAKRTWSYLLSFKNYFNLFTTALTGKLNKASVYPLDSGRSALLLALNILECRDTEVLVNAYTTEIVHKTILAAGATPRPFDIIPGTLEPDLGSLRDNWSNKVSAVIHTGLFGLPCNPSVIRDESHKKGIPMIEDSCNSLGTLWQGEELSCHGDLAILSFRVGKPLASGGGALIINNPKMVKHLNNKVEAPDTSTIKSLIYFLRILLDYVAFKPFILRFFSRPLRAYLNNRSIGRQLVRGGVVDTTSLPNLSQIKRMGKWQALFALANLEEYQHRIALRREIGKNIVRTCRDLPLKFLTNGLEDKWNGLFLPALLFSDCAEEYVEWMMRFGFEISRFHSKVPELSFSSRVLEGLPGTNLICKRLICVPCTLRMQDKVHHFHEATSLFFKKRSS